MRRHRLVGRPRPAAARPWITLAILLALVAGAGWAWWRSGAGTDPAAPSAGPTAGLPPGSDATDGARGQEPDEGVGTPGVDARGTAAADGAGNPLWPAVQPVDLSDGSAVQPRPVAMEAEGETGVLAVRGQRLRFVDPDGMATEIFRLPPGHRWASPVVPAPDGSAVAFLTRAEAGTPYLWVVRSDLTSTPYAVPEDVRRPATIAWAGPETLAVGDPPYLWQLESRRWSRLPGERLAWAGPPSPDGRSWAYGALGAEPGGGAHLYLVDLPRGEARPVDLASGRGAVALPGPWLDEGRFLAALVAGGPEAVGRTGEAPGPVQRVVTVEVPTGRAEPVFADPGVPWRVLGASPDGRWLVLVPGAGPGQPRADGGARSGGPAGRGSWRLVDVTTREAIDLPAGLVQAGVAWDGGGRRLFYLVAAGGSVRLEARSLGGRPGAGSSAGQGGAPGSPGTAEGGADADGGASVAPAPAPAASETWPPVRTAPGAIRRLLGVDPGAGVAWVELQGDPDATEGSEGAEGRVARWLLTEGRLEPLE